MTEEPRLEELMVKEVKDPMTNLMHSVQSLPPPPDSSSLFNIICFDISNYDKIFYGARMKEKTTRTVNENTSCFDGINTFKNFFNLS